MQYTRLGSSGLKVSRIALGCMSFGDRPGGCSDWALDDEAAEPIFRQAARPRASPSGTPPTSTACGTSEEIVGRAITQVHPPRGRRPGHQALLADARRPRRRRAVPQGHHGADRRLPRPARHRLRRPLPDPPLRPRDPGRGDDGGAARRGQGRQGPLPRGLLDVGLAVRQDAARRRAARLDPVRVHAGPVQPACSARRSGRCSACSPTRASARIPWSPLAKGRVDPPVGRAGTTRSASTRPDMFGRPLFVDGDQAIVDAVQQIAEDRGRPDGAGRAGLGAEEPGRRRPDRRARPSRTTSPTPSPRWTSRSPTRRSPPSRRPTPRASRRGSHDRRAAHPRPGRRRDRLDRPPRRLRGGPARPERPGLGPRR